MDRVGADFEAAVVSMMRSRLKCATPVAVMQLPMGRGRHFLGVIDLVKMKAIIWNYEDDERWVPTTN